MSMESPKHSVGVLKIILAIIISYFILSPHSLLMAGNNQDDSYLAFADVMPEPEGGLASLYKAIEYPEIAKKAGIEGKVYAMAFINEDGTVADVQIIKGLGGGCDEAVVKALKNYKFAPAQHQGKAVKVKMSLPITFQLK